MVNRHAEFISASNMKGTYAQLRPPNKFRAGSETSPPERYGRAQGDV